MSRLALTRRGFLTSSAAAATVLVSRRSLSQSSDPTDLTIQEAAALIRSGVISPVELTEAYLERIDNLDPRLNAFITITEDLALQQAREMETELSRGQWRGPLHGIPVALKDNIDTAGILTTAASAVFANRIPDEDAEVVRRLKGAGAILLGKLNMHEFAYGGTSDVTHYGPVHNPWDLDRIPGGSSGGSAAAVSARLCAAALGTDTAGSVRLPAAYCGIVGLKPTYGLASIRGIVPLGVSLDCVGPLCRTVADTAIVLQVLAGYDSGDIASVRAELPIYRSALNRTTSEMRLGVPREFYDGVDPQILARTEEGLEILRGMTALTQDVELPRFSGISPTRVEAYAYHAEYLETRGDLYQPQTLRAILNGADTPAEDYARARQELALIRKEIANVFAHVDLLVTPTLTVLPSRIRDDEASQPTEGPGSVPRNTRPFNHYGTPAISVPCGFSREGWPIGLQISGPHLGEVDVLTLAHAYEQATDWRNRRPPLT